MDITVREARDEDADAIASLLGELGYPTNATEVPARLATMRAEAGMWTIVAEADGQVVGMATVIVRHVINNDAPFGRLASVVVADGWRSHGIGGRLIAEAERICRDHGCFAMEVTSGTHRDRAHEFYRRLGYVDRPQRFIKTL